MSKELNDTALAAGATPGQSFSVGGQNIIVQPASNYDSNGNLKPPTDATGTPSQSSGGAKKEPATGYDKPEWHGTKILARTESGIEIRAGDTPGNRELWIKHPAGSYLQINDTGEVAFRAKGTHMDINLDNRTIVVAKDFLISVKGNLTLRAEKELNLEGKSVSVKSTGGNIDMKSAQNMTQEGKNWATAWNDRVDIKNGGDHAQTVGGKTNLTYNGDVQNSTKGTVTASVSGDKISMVGGEHSMSAGGSVGIGGSKVGIAATGTVKLNALGGAIVNAPRLDHNPTGGAGDD